MSVDRFPRIIRVFVADVDVGACVNVNSGWVLTSALSRFPRLFSQVFDSNCITPGTKFMAEVSKHLKYFIRKKIREDTMWQRLHVIFSGHEVGLHTCPLRRVVRCFAHSRRPVWLVVYRCLLRGVRSLERASTRSWTSFVR